MRPLALSIFLLPLFACHAPQKPLFDRLETAGRVWMLDHATTQGSGMPVSCTLREDGKWDILFLTAGHLVPLGRQNFWLALWRPEYDSEGSERVRLQGGRMLSVHEQEDAALMVFIADEPVPCVPLSPRELQFGDSVWAVGHPLGFELHITGGYAADVDSVTSPLCYGNSGGPIIDKDGYVVGIASSTAFVNRQMVFYLTELVPVSRLVEWLTSHGVPVHGEEGI